MIGLIHAYSRTNPGDGLLVDLSLRRLNRIGVTQQDVLLVALDSASFPDFPRSVNVGTVTRDASLALAPAAHRSASLIVSALARRPFGPIARKLARCSALVGVGGGYLRSPDARSSVGALLNHVPQLLFSSRTDVPSLYLPQSIGPLRGPVGRIIARSFRKIDAICVRDPWSETELENLPQLHRFPDLAALDIADCWQEVVGSRTTVGHRVGIAARWVPHATGYESHLQSLSSRLGEEAVWVVHTSGDTAESDSAHYGRLGIDSAGELREMLKRRSLALLVSVRLHGALMAIREGVPAIHLAYDRKGPAVFQDLGLSEWCFDIRALEDAALHAAVDSLRSNPDAYWDQLTKRIPGLEQLSAQLDQLINATLNPK